MPITWKNVNSASSAGALSALGQAGQGFSQGLNQIGQAAQSVANVKTEEETGTVLATLANLQNKEAFDSAMGSGDFTPDAIKSMFPNANLGIVANALKTREQEVNADSLSQAKETRTATEFNQEQKTLKDAANLENQQKQLGTFEAQGNFEEAIKLATDMGDATKANALRQAQRDTYKNQVRNSYATGNTVDPSTIYGEGFEKDPKKLADYQQAKMEGQAQQIKQQDTERLLKDMAVDSSAKEAVSAALQADDPEAAKAALTESGLSSVAMAPYLAEIDSFVEKSKVKAEEAKIEAASAYESELLSNFLQAEGGTGDNQRAMLDEISQYYLEKGIDPSRIDEFSLKVNKLNTLSTQEKADYAGLTQQATLVYYSAVSKVDRELSQIKTDMNSLAYQIPDNIAEANSVDTDTLINTKLEARFGDDIFAIDNSTKQNIISQLGDKLQTTGLMKDVPAWVKNQAIEKYLQAANNPDLVTGPLGDIDEEDVVASIIAGMKAEEVVYKRERKEIDSLVKQREAQEEIKNELLTRKIDVTTNITKGYSGSNKSRSTFINQAKDMMKTDAPKVNPFAR